MPPPPHHPNLCWAHLSVTRLLCASLSLHAALSRLMFNRLCLRLCLPPPPPFQVWFQNRRMKDKRQRLAMTWPHPADPAFYTYMMSQAAAAAAGNLSYPFPSHLPLPYYSHLGVGVGVGAGSSPLLTPPPRSLDPFRVLSQQPYHPRPELLCAFRPPSLYQGPAAGAAAAHGLGPGGSGGPGGGSCSCLACHPGGGRAPPSADFGCSPSSRTDAFVTTFTPSVLSKSSAVTLDQREEVPLTR